VDTYAIRILVPNREKVKIAAAGTLIAQDKQKTPVNAPLVGESKSATVPCVATGDFWLHLFQAVIYYGLDIQAAGFWLLMGKMGQELNVAGWAFEG